MEASGTSPGTPLYSSSDSDLSLSDSSKVAGKHLRHDVAPASPEKFRKLSLVERREKTSSKKRRSFSHVAPLVIQKDDTLPELHRCLSSPSSLSTEPVKPKPVTPSVKPESVTPPEKPKLAMAAERLWESLKKKKSEVAMCPDTLQQAYRFPLDEIPLETAIAIQSGQMVPHSRITLAGSKVGVAARGPHNEKEAEALFLTAAQENCKSIVNFRVALEEKHGNYPPQPGRQYDYPSCTVKNQTGQWEGLFENYESKLELTVEDSQHEMGYFWFTNFPNHTAGNAVELIKLSRKLPSGPVLVHCEKGEGRTAVFMLIHRLNQCVTQGMPAKGLAQLVEQMVLEGRRCRGTFLEMEEQLQTVLQAGEKLAGLKDDQLADAILEMYPAKPEPKPEPDLYC